jgi:hypothetical protein
MDIGVKYNRTYILQFVKTLSYGVLHAYNPRAAGLSIVKRKAARFYEVAQTGSPRRFMHNVLLAIHITTARNMSTA